MSVVCMASFDVSFQDTTLQPPSPPSQSFSHHPRSKLATICCPPPPSPPSAVLATVITLSLSAIVNSMISPKHENKYTEGIKYIRTTKNQNQNKDRGDLSGGEVCAGIEGSGGGNERLGGGNERLGGGGGDVLRGDVRRQVSETWSYSP
ncbi:hypothetical protein HID58_073930 [Brassica napus]|uniref:Uncharacterized protein n=1 Tax=Brassica napus TaxID=3708 RepID=A0ABQ7YHY1_BRANA|nr:hypothetical protein HID58_073930 [Brassica napus]